METVRAPQPKTDHMAAGEWAGARVPSVTGRLCSRKKVRPTAQSVLTASQPLALSLEERKYLCPESDQSRRLAARYLFASEAQWEDTERWHSPPRRRSPSRSGRLPRGTGDRPSVCAAKNQKHFWEAACLRVQLLGCRSLADTIRMTRDREKDLVQGVLEVRRSKSTVYRAPAC